MCQEKWDGMIGKLLYNISPRQFNWCWNRFKPPQKLADAFFHRGKRTTNFLAEFFAASETDGSRNLAWGLICILTSMWCWRWWIVVKWSETPRQGVMATAYGRIIKTWTYGIGNECKNKGTWATWIINDGGRDCMKTPRMWAVYEGGDVHNHTAIVRDANNPYRNAFNLQISRISSWCSLV